MVIKQNNINGCVYGIIKIIRMNISDRNKELFLVLEHFSMVNRYNGMNEKNKACGAIEKV